MNPSPRHWILLGTWTAVVLAAAPLWAQPRREPPRPAPDADRRIAELAERMEQMQRQIDELRQQLRQQAEECRREASSRLRVLVGRAQERVPRLGEMAENQARRMQERLRDLEDRIRQLRQSPQLSPPVLREKLQQLLREQMQALEKLAPPPPGDEARPAPPPGAAPAPPPRAGKDLVDTLASAGKFATFSKLIRESRLADELRRRGPFTVFAPTDAALEQMGKAKLAELIGNEDRLRKFVRAHVVPDSRIRQKDIAARKTVTSLAGREIAILRDGSMLKIGDAAVVDTVEASNGIIHGIDRVLEPGL